MDYHESSTWWMELLSRYITLVLCAVSDLLGKLVNQLVVGCHELAKEYKVSREA